MPESVRIVHAADIHLDSPLGGLGRLDADDGLVRQLRSATRAAFDSLVDYCLRTQPAALVIAGDLYDGDWRDYSTGAYFSDRMRDLDEGGIPVMVVAGNHDAASVITRTLTVPENVRFFATDQPQTVRLNHAGISFHGQGFAQPAVLRNLAVDYPAPDPGMVNIGILHTQVTGSVGHDPYAPCDLGNLTGHGYEYWALGHVHARGVLAAGPATVAYSGNLQGRSVRETGAKGALEVTLGPGQQADVQFIALDVARWEVADIDVTGMTTFTDVQQAAHEAIVAIVSQAGDRPVVARVHLRGVTPLAGRLADTRLVDYELRDVVRRAGAVLDRVRSKATTPAKSQRLTGPQREALTDQIKAVCDDPRQLRQDEAFRKDFDALVDEVSHQFTRDAGLDLRSDERVADVVRQAAERLLAALDGGS